MKIGVFARHCRCSTSSAPRVTRLQGGLHMKRLVALLACFAALGGCSGGPAAPNDGEVSNADGGMQQTQDGGGVDSQVPPGTDGGSPPASGWRALALPDDQASN